MNTQDDDCSLGSGFKDRLFKSHMYEVQIQNLIHGQNDKIPYGAVSPYDDYFKTYAKKSIGTGVLLAAIAFHSQALIP